MVRRGKARGAGMWWYGEDEQRGTGVPDALRC